MWEKIIDIKPEVKEALDANSPVVSLESTIISHGMPYPQNIQTAKVLEEIIRENGATPATIGVIDGRIKVGLSESDLEILGTAQNIIKVSRRDFPEVIAHNLHGATTVAGTMIISDIVGIRVFATGGIGGVHRNYGEVLDISQDLEELSKTNVVVVCAGVKSILDIRSTLEFLETKSIPVYVIDSHEFPAFYSRESGILVENKVSCLDDLAKIITTKWRYNLDGGVVVANPIPKKFSLKRVFIDSIIEKALESAKKNHINGKNVTPYLLKQIKLLTKGDSLNANIELVKSNAKIAAKLALEMNRFH